MKWYEFENSVFDNISKKIAMKKDTQRRKLHKLIDNKTTTNMCTPAMVPDFVCNQSDVIFSDSELALLNKGLKYTPKPNNIPLVEAIVDIESALKYRTYSVQSDIRRTTTNVIDNLHRDRHTVNNEFDIIKKLKESDCFFIKADKGNKIVILNKTDYDDRMIKLINESAYDEIRRNPLPKMIRECDDLRKSVSDTFGFRFKWKLKISNQTVAVLYGLPKIHKTGNKMRPIVSNLNTPCYKLAKWLVDEVKQLPPIESFAVKNTYDFTDKIKNVVLNDDEVMISFDFCSLFPSIPIDESLNEFGKYLESVKVPNNQKIIYEKVARTCMNHSYFKFRDKYYRVTKDTNMGNPLSPLMAKLLMAMFERDLKQKNMLPRI